MTTNYGQIPPGDGTRIEVPRTLLNAGLQNGIVRCTSDDMPTDASEGRYCHQTDTGEVMVWTLGRWTYHRWTTIDTNAPTLYGTRPTDLLATRPLRFQQSVIATVVNEAGGLQFPWPNVFPNCILWLDATGMRDNGGSILERVDTLNDNTTLGAWSGQAFKNSGPPDWDRGYLDVGQQVRINFLVIGC